MKWRAWDEAGSSTDSGEFDVSVNGFIGFGSNPKMTYNLPLDLTGKSKSNAQSYNIGYINTTDTASLARRVSEMWVNVEWLEATGSQPNRGLTGGMFEMTGGMWG